MLVPGGGRFAAGPAALVLPGAGVRVLHLGSCGWSAAGPQLVLPRWRPQCSLWLFLPLLACRLTTSVALQFDLGTSVSQHFWFSLQFVVCCPRPVFILPRTLLLGRFKTLDLALFSLLPSPDTPQWA